MKQALKYSALVITFALAITAGGLVMPRGNSRADTSTPTSTDYTCASGESVQANADGSFSCSGGDLVTSVNGTVTSAAPSLAAPVAATKCTP